MSSRTESPHISLETVADLDQLEAAFQAGLQQLYKDVFADPPYEEVFTDEEVRGIFQVLCLQGLLILAREQSEQVIGFVAALPLALKEEIAVIAEQFAIDVERTWYYAELGVAHAFRRQGVAQQLVLDLIANAPVDNLLMRTTENNTASRRANETVGFTVVADMVQQVEQMRQDGTIASDNRIFLQHTRTSVAVQESAD